MAGMLAVGIIPLLVAETVSLHMSTAAIEKQAFNQLDSVRQIKKHQIETYFKQILGQVETLSESEMIVNAVKSFTTAFHALPKEPGLSEVESKQYRQAVTDYYQDTFASQFTSQTGKQLVASRLLPQDEASFISQYHYIVNNGNPLGKKQKLVAAADESEYSRVHGRYHPVIRNYLEKFGYYDIFLVDPETGHIVYSVFKELDYATSLNTGPFRNTNIARVFKAALSGGKGKTHIADFEPYRPSYDAPASFVSAPVYEGNTLIGVLIFQMPVDQVNTIMQEKSGMGESGETYLVGNDQLMRSQSRFAQQNTIGKQLVSSRAVTQALAGKAGSGVMTDYSGKQVLSSYAPVAIRGLDWVIVSEIDEAEAFSPVHAMQMKVLIINLISTGLIVGCALLMGRNVRRQLGADPAHLVRVAEHIAQGDLDTDITAGSGTVTGVLASMKTMRDRLKENLETERQSANENARIRNALDNVSSNVMMADNNLDIIYLNHAVQKTFAELESDLRKDLPQFNASTLLGANIDIFHKNPAHQRDLLASLTRTFTSEMTIGGRNLRIIANPVFGQQGERLGTVVEWYDLSNDVAVKDVADIVSAARQGDLNQRIDLSTKEGSARELGAEINALLDIVAKVFTDIAAVMAAMSEGDLTRGIKTELAGSFGDVKAYINDTLSRLDKMVSRIRASTDAINNASSEIASGNSNLSSRTETQAANLEETATSLEQLTATAQHNADNARQASQLSTSAKQVAEEGGKVVANAIEAMSEISQSSHQIADIVGVIDEIAFQTNLLALNASVEAARAGEQGRGFAVVATEVRNLAQRSASSAREIKTLIQDSVTKVSQGTELVNESGVKLDEIVTSVKKVVDIIAEISAASTEQTLGVQQVNTAIQQIDEITQQNAALAEQVAAASGAMQQEAATMDSLMNNFRISAKRADSNIPGNFSAAANKVAPPSSNHICSDNSNSKVAEKRRTVVNGQEHWEEF